MVHRILTLTFIFLLARSFAQPIFESSPFSDRKQIEAWAEKAVPYASAVELTNIGY
jgi:hypothetical protein